MPRFFFDLHNDVDLQDDEGRELPNADAVAAAAMTEARQLIKVSIDETGRIDLRHHIDVRNDRGETVYVIHFEDAVSVQRGEKVLSQAALRFSG